MAAKAKQTQQMKGTPEVDANGVTPKSQRGRKQAKKPVSVGAVQNRHDKRGRNWLRLFVSGVLVTSAVGAEVTIYSAGLPAEAQPHVMWLVGITYAAAIGVVNFMHKLE